MNAKDIQIKVVKTYLKPTLNSQVYKTSGQTWWKNMGVFFTVINLQNFSWNNKDNSDFCFNIGLALPDHIKDPAKKKLTYNDIFSHKRDCYFVPISRLEHKYKNNTGYQLTADTNVQEFIEEMRKDFEKCILPLLDDLKTLKDWASFHEKFLRGELVKKYLNENYPQSS